MNNEVRDATLAGELATVQGVEYQLTPPGLEDWEWLQSKLRASRLEAVKFAVDALSEIDPRDKQAAAERTLYVDELYAKAFSADIFSMDGVNWLYSVQGRASIIYRCVKRNHPTVTLWQCHRWVFAKESQMIQGVEALSQRSINTPSENGNGAAKKNESRPASAKSGRRS